MNFLRNTIRLISTAVFTLPTILAEPCRILSLSGGGSHGAFEAGVVKSLLEEPDFKPWDVYLGVSAGGINVLSLTKDSFESNSDIIRDMWVKTATRDVIEPLTSSNSISGNGKVYSLLKNSHSSIQGNPTKGIFGVGVTDLVTGTFVILNIDTSNIIIDNFVASAAIPIVFPPVGSFVDGGLQKNEIFLSALKFCENSYDSVIMDLIFANYEAEQNVSGPWSMWKIASRSLDLIKEDFDNMYYKSVSSCKDFHSTLQLTVNIIMPKEPINISALDFDHGEYLWEMGYSNHTIQTVHC